MWVSPKYQDIDFSSPLTIDQKIILFEDRVIGWQLGIANQVINGDSISTGRPNENSIHGSGFAVLSIVFSYFEMIAKFSDGYTEKDKSKEYFNKGVHQVFQELDNYPAIEVTNLLTILYEGVRCGLYHDGMIGSKIILTIDLESAIGYDPQNHLLIINPHRLPIALINHFSTYIKELKDPSNITLRLNFEKKFKG